MENCHLRSVEKSVHFPVSGRLTTDMMKTFIEEISHEDENHPSSIVFASMYTMPKALPSTPSNEGCCHVRSSNPMQPRCQPGPRHLFSHDWPDRPR